MVLQGQRADKDQDQKLSVVSRAGAGAAGAGLEGGRDHRAKGEIRSSRRCGKGSGAAGADGKGAWHPEKEERMQVQIGEEAKKVQNKR